MSHRWTRGVWVAAVSWSILVLGSVSAPAAEGPPELLAPASGSARAAVVEESVMRSRGVQVLGDSLDGVDPAGGSSLRISFFDDASFVARLDERTDFGPGRYAWMGKLTGDVGGRVSLSVVDGVMIGNVWTEGAGSYAIRALPGGGNAAVELDQGNIGSCSMPDDEPLPDLPVSTEPDADASADCSEDGSVIDMLVVYTVTARNGAGGTAAMEALVQQMEVVTNDSYANSDIFTRIDIVGTLEVNYTESNNSSTDRGRITDPDDGFMDEVHPLRESLYADVVALITNNLESGNCGRAWFSITTGISAFPELGFNVNKRSCAVDNLTFPHELGHNEGMRHDTDGTDSPFNFSHGYKGSSFRTVMATCCSPPRVTQFSNPDVMFNGEPTGTAADADNARTLDLTAVHVANFRCNPGATPFALDLDKSLQGNADEDGSGDVSLNDTLTYSFVATNVGSEDVTAAIFDPRPGVSALSCTPTQPTVLASSETLSCTATYAVTQADVDARIINNQAIAASLEAPVVTDLESVAVASPIQLSVTTTCPSPAEGTIDVTGLTPNAGAILIFAGSLANWTIPVSSPVCPGATGVEVAPEGIQIVSADAQGELSIPANGACGVFVQVLDLTTCGFSNSDQVSP